MGKTDGSWQSQFCEPETRGTSQLQNPAGSLMWATDPFVALQKAVRNMVAFSFHTCIFKLWTSVGALKTFLERKCDEQHQHLPWGVTDAGGFATAEETAYNETLACTWAQAIADVASSEDIIMEPSTMYDTSDLHISQTKQLNKAFLGALPRGRRVPPVMTDLLVAEQFDIQHFSFLLNMAPNTRISDEHCKQFPAFPKGSRLLRFVNGSGVSDENEPRGSFKTKFCIYTNFNLIVKICKIYKFCIYTNFIFNYIV